MNDFLTKTCEPCRVGAPKLTENEITDYLNKRPGWEVILEDGVKKLKRKYSFKNFRQTLDFVNSVGEAAEENGHHPVMLVEYGALTIWWWTHKIGGLHENDFIMAAKIDASSGE